MKRVVGRVLLWVICVFHHVGAGCWCVPTCDSECGCCRPSPPACSSGGVQQPKKLR